nr:MAG TPA_asm: hypothetical protein [Caudoviricetes sp.]
MALNQLIVPCPRLIQELCVPIGNLAEGALNCLGRHRIVVVHMDGRADVVVPVNLHPVSVTMNVELAWVNSTGEVREDDAMGDVDRIVVYLIKEPIKKLFVDPFVVVSHYHDLVAGGFIHWKKETFDVLLLLSKCTKVAKEVECVVFSKIAQALFPDCKKFLIMLFYVFKQVLAFEFKDVFMAKVGVRDCKKHYFPFLDQRSHLSKISALVGFLPLSLSKSSMNSFFVR